MTKRILTLVLALALTAALLSTAALADSGASNAASDGQSVTISLNTLIKKKLISDVPFAQLPQTRFTITLIGTGESTKGISTTGTAVISESDMTLSNGVYTAEVYFRFPDDIASLVLTGACAQEFDVKEENSGIPGMTYDENDYAFTLETFWNADGKLSIHDNSVGYAYTENHDAKTGEINFRETAPGFYVFDTTWTIKGTYTYTEPDTQIGFSPAFLSKDTGMLNKTDHTAYIIGYPDGTIHPNGQITRAEVAAIFFRLLRDDVRSSAYTTANSYSDVAADKWYNASVSTMSALGIITGYPDGTFRPDQNITRAEFAAIAARFDESQSGKSAVFSDVIGHWAAKQIGIAYANEWIAGYPDGTFRPDQNITRAEAMATINRVLERKPETTSDLLADMNTWTDNMDASKWYYLDIQEATNSHAYTRKTFGGELWRQMLATPDWANYER